MVKGQPSQRARHDFPAHQPIVVKRVEKGEEASKPRAKLALLGCPRDLPVDSWAVVVEVSYK